MKLLTGNTIPPRVVALVLGAALTATAHASDHLDSPSTVANPQADIGDWFQAIAPKGVVVDLRERLSLGGAADGSERYSRCAKSIVQVGPPGANQSES
jgi:hypothetical protein